MNQVKTDRMADKGRATQTKKRKKAMVSIIVGGAIGGILGFLYYRFVGCSTGSCPLTSNPYTSTLYGIVIGALIGGNTGS